MCTAPRYFFSSFVVPWHFFSSFAAPLYGRHRESCCIPGTNSQFRNLNAVSICVCVCVWEGGG